MLKVRDIINEMNAIAPISLMQKGDNSGLLVGSHDDKAEKVIAALDITNEVVEEAKSRGADVIISHHPVIFSPLYSLTDKNPACRAAKYGIACICYHSPLDLVKGGMNEIIYDILKGPFSLKTPECFLEPVGELGYGLVCELEKEIEPEKAAYLLKEGFGCRFVRYSRGGRNIKKLAYCSGSGGGMLEEAIRLGADALITGDVKHDRMITAWNEGVTLFDCGHYHTEKIILPYLKKRFSEDLPQVSFEIAKADVDPCEYV